MLAEISQETEAQTSTTRLRLRLLADFGQHFISHLVAESFNPSLKISSNADIPTSW